MNGSMSIDKDLAALARAYGVATEYRDHVEVRQEVAAETVRAVLGALGVDASTTKSCRAALAALKQRRWEAVLPPVMVVRHTSGAEPEPWETWVHVELGASARIWIELEDGARRHDVLRTPRQAESAMINGKRIEEATYRIPHDLPLGYHKLVAETHGKQTSCSLVVTPERLFLPDPLSERRGWGVSTQLYSVRSRRSWGIGDLGDLSDMASWMGRELGSDFVLVNPLHAAAPVAPIEASPYLPVTRRYANPIYIRVEAVPEFAYLPAEAREQIAEASAPLHQNNLTADLIDRDSSWAAKRHALELVHEIPLSPGREAEFDDYLHEEGQGLEGFAIWCALAEEHGPHWNDWPQELQDPATPEVAAEAKRLADRVDFHRWLQWILAGQMGDAQRAAREAGMHIGVMHDLAVGVHPKGSDTWANADVMASQVTVGAPPDSFNQVGQDWSQPPPRPDQLAATGYASYRDMLRTLLRHSGGLRIDHVLGLFRLWWIPEGMPPSRGTYVRYDHHAMINILVLEAHRAGAVIVGEDLGTVESWVRDFLAERGILGTIILWFERSDEDRGTPKPPELWRSNAMASVTVHDIPPTRGFIAGDHVKLRAELNLLNRSEAEELAYHERWIARWREILESGGLLRKGAGTDEFVVALHRALTRSPARLLAVALPDMVGDRRAQNQPGTHDEYPNWRIPLCDRDGKPVLLDDLPNYDLVYTIVSAVGGASGGRRK